MAILKLREYWEKLGVYQGIVLFLVVMFASNFFWKLTVSGDENGLEASFLSFDVSSLFAGMCYHLAGVVHWIYDVFGVSTVLYDTAIYHPNGQGVRIVWGCNGIKQSFIFAMIMLFARGPFVHKLWFIPLGLVCVYLINVLRLLFLTYIIRDYPDMFEFWHGGVTKYLFYGLIFLMWMFWNDYLVPRFEGIKKVSN
jgi:exosortase/archaeosortase family protein